MEKIKTICVIDDDQIYHFTLRKLIEKSDLFKELLSFTDGEHALSFFRQNAENEENWPDVVLLDINMPIIDGWVFINEFNAMINTRTGKKMHVYMVSSSVDSRDIDRAKDIGVLQDYIVKPLTMDILRQIHTQYNTTVISPTIEG